jgi:hypothetical protein
MNSQWPTGVPPQMGGHLMASGDYAPTSTSTTCGTGAVHMFQYYDDEMTNLDVQVRVCVLCWLHTLHPLTAPHRRPDASTVSKRQAASGASEAACLKQLIGAL